MSDPLRETTDTANAERFVAQHADQVRWCLATGEWLTWEGYRWIRGEDGFVMRRARETADRIWLEAGPYFEAGNIKALAVTSAARSPAMPSVPTMKEAGVKPADVELRFWFGVFGPKGLPDAVKAQLEKALSAVMSNQGVRDRLAQLDITPDFAPGPALRTRLETEIKNWTRFIDAKGIRPE